MPKPRIFMWIDNDFSDLTAMETQLNNMGGGTGSLMRFDGYRSRGGRGFIGAYGDNCNIGNMASNQWGNPPKANAIVKADDLQAVQDGRLCSMDFGWSEAGGPQLGKTRYKWNAPTPATHILAGWHDRRMLDMLSEARFRSVVTSGVVGHPIEIPRSEANIAQGMGSFQPNSTSTQLGTTKYTELQAVATYMRRFVEGAQPGASGLHAMTGGPGGTNVAVDPGVLEWNLSLGVKQFFASSEGGPSGGPFHDDWAAGLTGIIDVLGADGYYNSATQDPPTFREMFEVPMQRANALGFKFSIPEHGVNAGASTPGGESMVTFKARWFREGFTWLGTLTRSQLSWIQWTWFSTNKYDDPTGAIQGFYDGWQAFNAAPDPSSSMKVLLIGDDG